ncbi:MAG: hypothetical protein MK212_12020 [Saprospiraceae bacterium]|nr:hypothetical protein [Saprospiraceae bacterium]
MAKLFNTYIITICILVSILFCVESFAQNKSQRPQTYRDVCFLAINREGFEEYKRIQGAVLSNEYKQVYPIIKSMRKQLKRFDIKRYDRQFEFWYNANYINFEEQTEVARQSTLRALDIYEQRLKNNTAKYFDHRMFLNSLLAFLTEEFFPQYWFMSMERYFSHKCIDRIETDNPEEGKELFNFGNFYHRFDEFDAMILAEEEEMKAYLQIGQYGEDSSGIGNRPLISYSYGYLGKTEASYILERFKLDDASQDLAVDREVRALERFLKQSKSKQIWMVVRFNNVPFRDTKN